MPSRSRPSTSSEVQDLIKQLSGWGVPRIVGELRKLGIQATKSTVEKYRVKHPKSPSPTWRSFLGDRHAARPERSYAVAAHLAREIPQHFTANMAKQRRKGKIFIDYLRNGRGSTAVAAYSTRSRPGAPVFVPLAWPELDNDVRGDHFNITTVRARLLKLRRDPWADYDSVRHTITARMKRSLGIK